MSNKWTWETAHLSPGAGVILVKKINQRWQTFGMWSRGGFDIPKGHVEDGDDHLNTAIRECEEECGIKDLNFKWGYDYILLENLVVYLATTEQTGKIIANKHTGIYEHESCKWMTFDEMKEGTYNYLVRGIEWAEEKVTSESRAK